MQELEGNEIEFVGHDEISIGDGDAILIVNLCADILYLCSKDYGKGFPLEQNQWVAMRIPNGSVLKLNSGADVNIGNYKYIIIPKGASIEYGG